MSREDPQLKLRLPEELKSAVELGASANHRSTNAEIVSRLELSFAGCGQPSAAQENEDDFEWAIVEVFGHRRHAGRAREEERFGAKMLRIDVPTVAIIGVDLSAEAGGGSETSSAVTGWTTHWYGGSSIFSYTLTDEATVLRINRPSYSPQRYIAPPMGDDYDKEDIY